MLTPREIFVPQAMQRHTGCAWVHPARAAEKTEKPKFDSKFDSKFDTKPEAADGRAIGTCEK
ncbi:MAG: hypothetical protein JO000_10640 [Alphaproteobacteria bacterium]|nr:hypothetical protein [Alphaproteobacteria bacterium]